MTNYRKRVYHWPWNFKRFFRMKQFFINEKSHLVNSQEIKNVKINVFWNCIYTYGFTYYSQSKNTKFSFVCPIFFCKKDLLGYGTKQFYKNVVFVFYRKVFWTIPYNGERFLPDVTNTQNNGEVHTKQQFSTNLITFVMNV